MAGWWSVRIFKAGWVLVGIFFWLGGDGWGSVGMSGDRWGIFFGSVGGEWG